MSILTKHHGKIVWILIGLYIIFFSSFCLWKYANLGYNSLDLAIINQVFYNTAHGLPFVSSIHAPSYLGDHFTPIIFLLLPFYFICQSPIALLLLQTIFLALAAYPLYLIGKNIFKEPKLYLLLPLAYLLSPFLHNINVFEFHELPLAFGFLFFAFYFYQKNRFWPWLGFIALSLLVREDVAFFVGCFGLFILADKLLNKEKIKLRWVLTPMILSVLYLALAFFITAHFSPSEHYKFLIYYSWLGNSLPQIIINLFSHPLLLLQHLLRLKNLEMTLALLLPFLFLPLVKPRYLILALGTFLQLTISDIGGSVLIVQLHYVTLLAIPLFIGFGYGLEYLWQRPPVKKYHDLTILLLLITIVYSAATLGFGRPKIMEPENLATKKKLLQQIPPRAPVIASYEFLAPLSTRPQVYSLNYSFLGRKQLSDAPYSLPDNIEYLIANLNETVTYQLQYAGLNFYRPNYYLGAANLRKLLTDQRLGLVTLADTIALFKKNYSPNLKIYALEKAPPQNLFNCSPKPTAASGELPASPNRGERAVSFFCSVQFINPPRVNYQLELELKKDGQNISSRLLPLAYGFYTTSELKPDEILTTDYNLKTNNASATSACLNLVELQGALGLNKMGELYNFIESKKILQTNCFDF